MSRGSVSFICFFFFWPSCTRSSGQSRILQPASLYPCTAVSRRLKSVFEGKGQFAAHRSSEGHVDQQRFAKKEARSLIRGPDLLLLLLLLLFPPG